MTPAVQVDLTAYTVPLLALGGVAFQWFRSFVKVSPFWYAVIAITAAAVVYGLTHNPDPDLRLTIINALLFVSGNVATIVGGASATEKLAQHSVSIGADPEHWSVPVTRTDPPKPGGTT